MRCDWCVQLKATGVQCCHARASGTDDEQQRKREKARERERAGKEKQKEICKEPFEASPDGGVEFDA